MRGRTSRKVPVWPPVQVTPRQPCLSCGAWLPVASFLHFFASRSHQFIFILAAFSTSTQVFPSMSLLLLFPAIRPLTQQCQSLIVFTVRPHPESDLLLSLFIHVSLYLPRCRQTLLLFQRPVSFKRHGPSHGIVSDQLVHLLLFAAQAV